MSELLGLFDKYGTPKDGYTAIYEMLFQDQRLEITSVLEIGIGTMIPSAPSSMVNWALPGYRPGGSLRAWRDWFPNAEITGLDIQPDTFFSEPRIQTYLCNSQSIADVLTCLGVPSQDLNPDTAFDIIIDDASHSVYGQLLTCENLYPYLVGGGYYVIEDAGELTSDIRAMDELSALTNSASRLVATKDANDLMNDFVVIFKSRTS